jgi:hypothetical protein
MAWHGLACNTVGSTRHVNVGLAVAVFVVVLWSVGRQAHWAESVGVGARPGPARLGDRGEQFAANCGTVSWYTRRLRSYC